MSGKLVNGAIEQAISDAHRVDLSGIEGLAMPGTGEGWTWGSEGNGDYTTPANLGDVDSKMIAEVAPRPQYASPLIAKHLGGNGIAGYAQAA